MAHFSIDTGALEGSGGQLRSAAGRLGDVGLAVRVSPGPITGGAACDAALQEFCATWSHWTDVAAEVSHKVAVILEEASVQYAESDDQAIQAVMAP